MSFTSGKISHDPMPYEVGSPIDGRTLRSDHEPTVPVEFCDYCPRSEYDHHNPILVWLRAIWDDPKCGTHAQILDYMRNDVRMIGSEFSPAERAHARRVLSNLAALS